VRALALTGILAAAAAAAGACPALADECPDALITAAVKSRLIVDSGLAPFKINVDTDECVVTLKGCLNSKKEIRRAGSLAGRVKRVRSVRNQLTVCPQEKRGE